MLSSLFYSSTSVCSLHLSSSIFISFISHLSPFLAPKVIDNEVRDCCYSLYFYEVRILSSIIREDWCPYFLIIVFWQAKTANARLQMDKAFNITILLNNVASSSHAALLYPSLTSSYKYLIILARITRLITHPFLILQVSLLICMVKQCSASGKNCLDSGGFASCCNTLSNGATSAYCWN